MNRKPRLPNYFREWREYRGLTLRELAAQMLDDDGKPLISYASLGRIERGLQPYSQPILEAMSEVLGVHPGFLLGEKPNGQAAELSHMWFSLSHAQRAVVSAAILTLLRAAAESEKEK